ECSTSHRSRASRHRASCRRGRSDPLRPSRAGLALREQMSGADVAGVGPPHRFPDLAASGVTSGEAPVVLVADGLAAQPMEPVALAHLAVATVVVVGLLVPAAAVQLVVLQAMCVALHVGALLAL